MTYVCGAEHPPTLGTEFDGDAREVDVFQGSFLFIVGFGLGCGVGHVGCQWR